MSESIENPWDSQILFVTGKGGVGKSTVAAAIALRESRRGRKILLVELGDESFYSEFFKLNGVSQKPTSLFPNLDIARWDSEHCLREYVLHYIKVERIYNLFFENKVMRRLINVAPPLRELALLGKITSGVLKIGTPMNYDLIVIDAFSTGHTLALLRAPRGIGETISVGPMGDRSRAILKTLLDPKITRYFIVTLPDELPTNETLELAQTLKEEFQIHASIAVNRIVQPPLDQDELEILSRDSSQDVGLVNFARYLLAVTARQARNLIRLSKVSPPYRIPLVTAHTTGRELIEQVAGAFHD